MKSLLKLKDDLHADTMWIHFVRGVVEITVIRHGKKTVSQSKTFSEETMNSAYGGNLLVEAAFHKFKERK